MQARGLSRNLTVQIRKTGVDKLEDEKNHEKQEQGEVSTNRSKAKSQQSRRLRTIVHGDNLCDIATSITARSSKAASIVARRKSSCRSCVGAGGGTWFPLPLSPSIRRSPLSGEARRAELRKLTFEKRNDLNGDNQPRRGRGNPHLLSIRAVLGDTVCANSPCSCRPTNAPMWQAR